jgi:ribonuclease BN (tRNA processing enzyme)
VIAVFCLNVQAECQHSRVKVQVLGSGGPELTDKRASSGYLVWLDNKAVVMVDSGPGSMVNYEKTGANPNDLRIVLFSHLHVDHSADFPALIKGFYFTERDRDLWVFGPTGNQWLPATDKFVDQLFSSKGLYPYLRQYNDTHRSAKYAIKTQNIDVKNRQIQVVKTDWQAIALATVSVHHGPLPALAWRLDVAGCRLVFSGDMSNHYQRLAALAKQADLLVAHHAIPEQSKGVARKLHMPPSEIGKIAGKAKVKKLVLSHRMSRTIGVEAQSRKIIRREYTGPIFFANDLAQYRPGNQGGAEQIIFDLSSPAN